MILDNNNYDSNSYDEDVDRTDFTMNLIFLFLNLETRAEKWWPMAEEWGNPRHNVLWFRNLVC